VVDEEGSILLKNSTAKTILQRETAISVQNGVLSAPAHKATLRSLIASVGSGSRELHLACIPRSEKQQPLILAATSIEWPSDSADDDGVAVAVIVCDPEFRWLIPDSVLRPLYGLTRAEAELASHLINGDSLSRIATKTGSSLNTIRSHLKKLFQKTGTRRQAELVRLLLVASMLLGAPAEMKVPGAVGPA